MVSQWPLWGSLWTLGGVSQGVSLMSHYMDGYLEAIKYH